MIHAKGMENLSLSVTCRDGYAHFSITDDGCGIDPERMGQLFTGYLDRKDMPTDVGRSNMGIGLSVCATIVKAHGSEIYARNRKPHGVEFGFALKMEDMDEQQ